MAWALIIGKWAANVPKTHGHGLLLFLVGLVTLVGAMAILELAGVQIRVASDWLPDLVVSEKPNLQVVPAAVTWVAAGSALITYLFTNAQKERHHRESLIETRRIEDQRERRDRYLAKLERLEEEFAALCDDFAQDSKLARINAAIGLAEIAIAPDPVHFDEHGRLTVDDRQPVFYIDWTNSDSAGFDRTRYEWPAEWRSKKTERNYPFYKKSARRLAEALIQWDDAAEKSQARLAISRMASWAKDYKTDEPLLHELVNILAEANRAADRLFMGIAGALLNGLGADRSKLEAILDWTVPEPVDFMEEFARQAFWKRASDGEVERRPAPAVRSSSASRNSRTTELESRLISAFHALEATRDALIECIEHLSQPPEILPVPGRRPRLEGSAQSPDNHGELCSWDDAFAQVRSSYEVCRERRNLDLKDVNLAFGEWFGPHLESADLSCAFMTGGKFRVSFLQGAWLENASFAASELGLSILIGAHMQGVQLEHADAAGSTFTGASAYKGNFANSNLSGCSMDIVNCS